MSQDTFQWTDELVHEYVAKHIILGNAVNAKEALAKFKEEKTKRDWEIVRTGFQGAIEGVRRLSDLEKFYIGDEIGGLGVIDSFKVDDKYIDGLYVTFKSGQTWTISVLQKVVKPKPLFVTEDGVEIRNVDTVFYCDTIKWQTSYVMNLYHYRKEDGYRYFSTKEKAEEYILLNKPLLSLKEIHEAMFIEVGLTKQDSFGIMKMFAKEKLSK